MSSGNFDQQAFETLLEKSSDNVLITDGDGKILQASSNIRRIYAVPGGDIIGQNVEELERRQILRPSVTMQVLRQKKEVHLMQTTSAGNQVMALGFPIVNDAGHIVRVVSFSRDMTDFNILRREFQALQKNRVGANSNEFENDVPGVVFRSQIIGEVISLVRRVSRSDLAILFLGESGVGKTELARFAHNKSLFAAGPFIDINCAAIPESIFESEIFGYEAGAFSGADRKGKDGILQAAEGGTLFLDEVAELPAALQSKLLKVLQDGEYRKLGSNTPHRANFRLMCATNRNLMQMVEDGSFRLDLYYRISGFPVYVPALRERREDIPPIVDKILSDLNEQYGQRKQISENVIRELMTRSWQGNVRELKMTLERWYVLSPGSSIQIRKEDNIPPSSDDISVAQLPQSAEHNATAIHLTTAVETFEKNFIANACRHCQSTYQLAERLGISQPTIVRKLKKYGLRCGLQGE